MMINNQRFVDRLAELKSGQHILRGLLTEGIKRQLIGSQEVATETRDVLQLRLRLPDDITIVTPGGSE